jgi:hypothetical protein
VERDGGDPCGASGGGLAVPRERGDEIGGALDLRERRRAAWRWLRGSRFSSPLTYLGLSRLATARWKVAAGQGSGRRRAPAPPVVSFICTRWLAAQRWATSRGSLPRACSSSISCGDAHVAHAPPPWHILISVGQVSCCFLSLSRVLRCGLLLDVLDVCALLVVTGDEGAEDCRR